MIDSYRLLLEKAGRRYEKHKAGHPEPFNVFSVLRSQHDEVNLHSRFLHSLLDYRQPPNKTRENLADFLCSDFLRDLSRKLSGDEPDLDPNRAKVDREIDNIDILIRDPTSMQAIVIENKIWAGDQPQQLRRYAQQLKKEGYNKPYLLYLTLYGHEPSDDSVGELEYECISYKENIRSWLKRCQQRAYDEPAMRESVAQYRHLIAKLTNTDYNEAYMKELKELCLEGENLVLVHDLNEAMVEARVWLLHKLWQEIECSLKKDLPDLPDLSKEDSDISEQRIRRFVTYQRGYRYHGIYFKFSRHACLGVDVEDSICYGIYCPKEKSENEYNRLKKVLEKVPGQSISNQWWPWCRVAPDLNLKYPTRENLELLANKEKRQEYVSAVVSGLSDVWKNINDVGLACPQSRDQGPADEEMIAEHKS